jgi:hypothetical protein
MTARETARMKARVRLLELLVEAATQAKPANVELRIDVDFTHVLTGKELKRCRPLLVELMVGLKKKRKP